MGCDIHAFIEEKRDGQWRYGPAIYEIDFRRTDWGRETFDGLDYEAANCPIDQRNYRLFGFMAGVRSDITPCLHLLRLQEGGPVRGEPDDMAPETMKEYEGWRGCVHSDSWLTLEEMRTGLMASALAGKHEGFAEQLDFSLTQMEKRCADTGLHPADMRVIFWFDN